MRLKGRWIVLRALAVYAGAAGGLLLALILPITTWDLYSGSGFGALVSGSVGLGLVLSLCIAAVLLGAVVGMIARGRAGVAAMAAFVGSILFVAIIAIAVTAVSPEADALWLSLTSAVGAPALAAVTAYAAREDELQQSPPPADQPAFPTSSDLLAPRRHGLLAWLKEEL